MNIWKFPLFVSDEQSVDMPADAAILAVQVQNGVPCIWALVGPSFAPEPRTFRMVGTGHEFDGNGKHVGTFQLASGALVFHLFEMSR